MLLFCDGAKPEKDDEEACSGFLFLMSPVDFFWIAVVILAREVKMISSSVDRNDDVTESMYPMHSLVGGNDGGIELMSVMTSLIDWKDVTLRLYCVDVVIGISSSATIESSIITESSFSQFVLLPMSTSSSSTRSALMS